MTTVILFIALLVYLAFLARASWRSYQAIKTPDLPSTRRALDAVWTAFLVYALFNIVDSLVK